jgi:hypothetical protein
MEAICDPDNIEAALRTVVRNKGARISQRTRAKQVQGFTCRKSPVLMSAIGRNRPNS